MANDWQTVRIGDVAEVFDGPHATPTKTDRGPWYLSISSLKNGNVDLKESAHLSPADFSAWTRRVQPEVGDTLFSYETRLGEAGYWQHTSPAALGRRMGLLRPRRDKVDPRFLTYAYLGPQFQEEIRRRAIHGATVDRIPIAELAEWPLQIPPLVEQRDIANVLGALDDLVDAENRIQRSVLDLAQTLYLSAAGRATDEVRLGDVGVWLSGGTPSTGNSAYWGGETPWISAASLKSFFLTSSDRAVTPEGAASGTRIVSKGAILFVVRGMSLKSEFRVGVAQREVAFGQDCKAIVVDREYPRATVGVALLALSDQILTLVDEAGHGTGRLPTDRIENQLIRLPRQRERELVEQVLSSLLELGADAAASGAALRTVRDELLPLLLSGRVRVDEVAA